MLGELYYPERCKMWKAKEIGSGVHANSVFFATFLELSNDRKIKSLFKKQSHMASLLPAVQGAVLHLYRAIT